MVRVRDYLFLANVAVLQPSWYREFSDQLNRLDQLEVFEDESFWIDSINQNIYDTSHIHNKNNFSYLFSYNINI